MVPWFSGDYGMRLSLVFKFYLVRVAVDDRMMLRGQFLSENYVIIQRLGSEVHFLGVTSKGALAGWTVDMSF